MPLDTVGLQNKLGEILRNISRPQVCGKGKCLASLNAFVRLLHSSKCPTAWKKELHGFNFGEICLCLRICLVHEATVVRIAALRALRYLVNCEKELIIVNSLGIPLLVIRSLDIILNNSAERLQAVRFCQKILSFPGGAKLFPISILRGLIAVAFDGLHDKDKIHHVSLSILCQLLILSPDLFIKCGGIRVMIQNLLVYTSPLLAEAILSGLLQLLNSPETRTAADLCLLPLVAPFTDHHFKLSSGETTGKRQSEDRDNGYNCSKLAIGIILRSWNGITHLCHKDGNCELQALVDSLYIEQLEVRKTILDLISEIIGLKFPTWTDEMAVALSNSDLMQENSSWKLQEGFVVEEALSVLPHLASVTPNLKANHLALLIYCFASKGLLDALVEVIVTSDTFISVRATMLLGEFLSLIDRFLPTECFDPSKSVPTLIEYATGPLKIPGYSSADVSLQMKQHRAIEAITVLSAVRKHKAKSAVPFSTFLQIQVTFAGYQRKHSDDFIDRLGELQLNRQLGKDIENGPAKLLKETSILVSKDPMSWQWETICTIFRWCPMMLRRVDDSSWRLFLRRLVDFYKPSSNLFGRIDKGSESGNLYTKVGCYLVEFLAEHVQNFCGTLLLDEFLSDIAIQIDDLLAHTQNVHEAHWNPVRLETTLSQNYVIFIGALTKNFNGYKALEKCEILPRLLKLTCEMRHDHYVKLIISSLNYGEEFCRRILSTALTSSMETIREYATRFLRVLVRLKPQDFSKWGIEFLVNQLKDESPVIGKIALNILEEAIHDKMFLESLISLRPALSHLGDRGKLIMVTFLSLPSGYKLILEANTLKNEVDFWRTHFNERYVDIVEVMIRDNFSTLRRGTDGKYPTRMSLTDDDSNNKLVDIYVPSHLYGQLAQHKFGLDILIEVGQINGLIKVVKSRKYETDSEIKEMKACLWALSHMATSVDAFPIVEEANVINVMVRLARGCPILSIRHTIFHCLCLISSTSPGAECLRRLAWHTMPRTHHDIYPIWRFAVPWESQIPDDLQVDLDSISIGKTSTYSKADSECINATGGADEPSPIGKGGLQLDTYDDSFVLEEDENEGEGEESILEMSKSDQREELIHNGRRNSASTSIHTTRSLYMDGLNEGSPSYAMRTVIRKPIIRMPVLSDPDLYPPHPSPQGRLSLRELKLGSLDRHSFITPGDLFNESKLVRANTSMTSLSTPSFRSHKRDETNLKGPCFMGLCLPKELSMIFKLEESERVQYATATTSTVDSVDVIPEPSDTLHSSATCLSCALNNPTNSEWLHCDETLATALAEDQKEEEVEAAAPAEQPNPASASSMRKHKSAKIRQEIIRLVSNMISCVGAKTNEQALLRLKQQYPFAFQNLCTYSEICVLMSRYNIRSGLRRFIQELFYDLTYEKFYTIAAELFQEPLTLPANKTLNNLPHTNATAVAEAKTSGDANLKLQKSISEETQVEVDMQNIDTDFIDLK